MSWTPSKPPPMTPPTVPLGTLKTGTYWPCAPNGEPISKPPVTSWQVAVAPEFERPAAVQLGVSTLATRGTTPGELRIFAARPFGRTLWIELRNWEVSTKTGEEVSL